MSLFIEVIILLGTIVSILGYLFYERVYRLNKFLQRFPTPSTSILLGCVPDFKTPAGFFQKLNEYTEKYGSIVHLQLGPVGHALLCSDTKFLEFLLSHNKLLKKTINLQYLEPWIGKGLVTADGPRWKTHRKIITPAFHFKILEQFVDIFESDGNILVEHLKNENGSKSFDVYPYISKCTLDAILETAMGVKVDVQNGQAASYFQSVKEMCRIFLLRTNSPLLHYDFVFRFTKNYKIQKESLKILHGYSRSVIQARRKELQEKEKNTNENVDDLGRKRKKAFLDLILEARVDNQSLTDEEIREEVDTFMFAGHDTTATATTFTLYCLANHKHVQDKLLEEQKKIFGEEKNPKVTYTSLQDMKYLENVIKESLRRYSTVPLFGRLIDQDVEYNGITFPKHLGVLVFVHGIHMNPEYYPNPEKFNPDRFETMENKQPFSFIPFSAGPRNCIGQKFAMLELKSLVSKIVRNYELLPALPTHTMKLAPETVLKSLNGVKIGLRLR